MKAIELFALLKQNQVGPNEEVYFASDEEANSVFSKVELIQFTTDEGKYLTFVPASSPIDSLNL